MASRRFCIVLLTAVGDAVHVLPVVNAIRRAEPRAHISWVMQPGPARLVRGHPALDDVILFERSRGWRAFRDVRRELARRSFDVVLGLQTYLKAGLITAFTRAPVKVGYDRGRGSDLNWLFTSERISPAPARHTQDEYLEFVQHLGIDPQPVEWGLGPWPEEMAYRAAVEARFDRPMAMMVIGSSKPVKDWVPERWAEVAGALHGDFGLQPVVAGGGSPREMETERIIMERSGVPVVSLQRSTLRELVCELDASALVVSLDTGPLHMAVALDRPTISLLAYHNPLRTGPYRRFHDLMVSAYGETERHGELTSDRRPGRMPLIQVREVLERVETWRERYSGATRESPRKS